MNQWIFFFFIVEIWWNFDVFLFSFGRSLIRRKDEWWKEFRKIFSFVFIEKRKKIVFVEFFFCDENDDRLTSVWLKRRRNLGWFNFIRFDSTSRIFVRYIFCSSSINCRISRVFDQHRQIRLCTVSPRVLCLLFSTSSSDKSFFCWASFRQVFWHRIDSIVRLSIRNLIKNRLTLVDFKEKSHLSRCVNENKGKVLKISTSFKIQKKNLGFNRTFVELSIEFDVFSMIKGSTRIKSNVKWFFFVDEQNMLHDFVSGRVLHFQDEIFS